MPIIKSAKKRVRVARKATVRNAKTKRNLRNAVKAFNKAIGSNAKDVTELHKAAQSELSKAGKKHVMHKNKVARKQRQLATAAKAAGVKATTTKKPAAAKKTTPKKAPSKPATKSVAKKSTSASTKKK